MAVKATRPKINTVGAIDWVGRVFYELITAHYGTSYNSYLIKGSEKTTLIDTVDSTKSHELIETFSAGQVIINETKLTYKKSNF